MEQCEEDVIDHAAAHGIGVDESPDFLEGNLRETDEFEPNPDDRAAESPFTDDPVRVYLREMGSVSLLNRQGEIDLARRMERGKLRMRKALSRSPLVWQSVLSLYGDVREDKVRLEDFVEIGGRDDAAREDARTAITRRLAKFARLNKELLDLERKIAAAPAPHVNLRAKLSSKVPRLKFNGSHEQRGNRFST